MKRTPRQCQLPGSIQLQGLGGTLQLPLFISVCDAQSDQPSLDFLPKIREVAKSLSSGTDEVAGALGRVITAAVACVDKISLDRKVDVQRLGSLATNSQGNMSLQEPIKGTVNDGATSPQLLRAPSGLLGDPFQMRQWYLHSFFGNFTVEADRTWRKLEATESK